MSFTSDGGVLVSDYSGNVRKFPDDSDGQDARAIVPSQNYGADRAIDMTQIGDRIYMSQGSNGSVVEINEDGTFKQLIVSGLGRVLGIDVNPSNGHLLVASLSNVVYDIDPIAKTAKVLFNAFLDGISVSPDGLVLYGATVSSSTIVGFSLAAAGLGNIVFDSGPIQGGVDGAALGFGDSAGYIFANTNQGTVVAIDLRTKQQTLIATGGTRGDFAKVDPRDGTLLLTQSSTIARLQLPTGSSFRTNYKVGIRVEDGKGGADVQDFVLQLTDGTAEIRGQVRQDSSTQANPPGLPDFVVYLDQNQNGLLDSGERFTTTDSSGNYAFSGLIADTYTVAQGVHSGWRQTGPVEGAYSITLINGQSNPGFDFTNTPSTVAEIHGLKFHDLNGDGVRTSATTSVQANVPGISNPWLAGMPDGTGAGLGDVSPTMSPIEFAGLSLSPGTAVTFQVSGSVNVDSSPSGDPPDGNLLGPISHGFGGDQHGISDVTAPVNSLVALFLGPDQPNLSPAPAALDFSVTGNVPGGTEYRILSPQLKQVFFVGDGLTSSGVSQQIIIPEGATRLFLGTMDGVGWFNNSGTFEVAVTALQTEPGLRGWTIYLDQNTNGQRDPNEPSTVTDSKGEYAFTNLAPETYLVAEESYPTYDAVRDFTTDKNPNSPWTYGFTQTRGSTFQQSTLTGVNSSLDYWSATTSGPHITHNLTGNTIPGGITYPPDALNLDPSFDGRNSVLRFTAPVTDTYHLTGRFQGIDLTRGSTTDVAILQNSNSILTGNINGFFTDLATTPGAIVPYDLQVTLQQGETLDFSVGQGTGGSLFDSTGVSAIIVGKNWRQTAPVTKTHQITVLAGEVRKRVEFGNLELAAQPPTNHAPQITSTAETESGVGARYRSQATATDLDGDRLTFDLPVKPVGMIVDPRTGMIVWTPTADQAGVQNVILRVSDGKGGVDLQSFQVTVASRNSGPTITSRPQGPAQANLPYQYRIRAQDAEGDTIEFSLSTPAIGNMAVDSATGVFSWLPTSSDIGSHTIEVTATDSSGDGQLQKFTLVVLASGPNRDPEILSTPREQVRLGNSYLYALDAIDPDGDPLTYRLDDAPSGMTIDGNGMITWTPTAAQFGIQPVQVSISDGRGGVRIQTFNIAVQSKAENHAPLISSTATLAATLGTEYRYSVQATDVDGDTLAFSLDSKPNGMSIDALSGAIRWIPTADQLGTQSIIVRVTDPQGSSATQSFTVTVRGSNLPPEISSVPKTTAAVGRTYSYVVKATDPEGGPLTYSLTAKSGNMIIDSSGRIQWVPGAAEVGNVNVTVRVADDQGASVEQSFTVVVAAVGPNLPPIITSQPNLGATVGQPYQYQVTATDPDGGPVRFAFLEVPDGMTIDESSGLIQWTSDAAGIGRVTVLVGDFDGGDAEQSFEVTVRSINLAPQITSTPVVNTATGVTYHYDVRANDPNFDPLSYVLETGPVGMAIDNLGRITWTTTTADAGTHRVKFTVSDDLGATAEQEYDLVVTADTEDPRVRIQVSSNPVGLAETLIIQVNATDNIGVTALDVTVDGQAVALDARGRASVLMSKAGSVRIAAVASDAAGNTGRQTTDVLVVDTSITEAPTVDVTVPTENATITAPTDVIGTIQDPNLVSWKLEVAPFDGGDFKQIATGTTEVSNGKLGTFDPTRFPNDSYVLRLTAVNRGGLSSSIDTTIHVAGNLKLGNFTMSFTDLSIPVAGIPILVTRSYDSFRASQQTDLGFGWSLSFRDVDLRTNLAKTGDESGGLYAAFKDGTRVYVTLPGGKREGYTFRPKAVSLFDQFQRERDVPPEYQPGTGLNAVYFVPSFVPDKGVTNKLTVPRYQLTKQGHEYVQFGGGIAYNPQDPSFGGRFSLTTKEGINYVIDAETSKVRSISDKLSNSLRFEESRITSSSGAHIEIRRDLQNRIVAIVDPAGNTIQYEYDSNGDLSQVTDRTGNKTQFIYRTTPRHYLDRVIDAAGKTGVRTELDDQGRIVSMTDSAGNATTKIYGNLTEEIVDSLGRRTLYQYDEQGNTIREVDAAGGITSQSFDSNNNVLSITNPLGFTTTFSYDVNGNRTSVTNAQGQTSYFTYDERGQILSTTNSQGLSTKNLFDEQGNIQAVEDELGTKSEFKADAQGGLKLMTDALGNKTQFTNDRFGRLINRVDALNNSTTTEYDANGNPVSESVKVTTASSVQTLTTRRTFDANGRVLQETDPTGAITRTEYDALGQVTATIDPLGNTTRFKYDDRGLLIETQLPDGTTTKSVYDAEAQLIASIDQAGRITKYQYDALGRPVTTLLPDNTPTDDSDNPRQRSEYDAVGNVTATIDPLGNRTESTFDSLGRLVSVRNAIGNVIRYEYDTSGKRVATIDAKGIKTRYVYDPAGRPVQTIYPDGSTTKIVLDQAGRIAKQVDQLGTETRYEYDALGRQTAVVDALGNRTRSEYDELGRVIRRIDAKGNETRFEYNDLERSATLVRPGGQRTTTTSDAARPTDTTNGL